MTDSTLRNATFELVGPDSLTYEEIASIVSEELGRPLHVKIMDHKIREAFAQSQNWSPYAVQAFLKMNQYYDDHGFSGGNSLVLTSILKRPPNNYRSFIQRLIAIDGNS